MVRERVKFAVTFRGVVRVSIGLLLYVIRVRAVVWDSWKWFFYKALLLGMVDDIVNKTIRCVKCFWSMLNQYGVLSVYGQCVKCVWSTC